MYLHESIKLKELEILVLTNAYKTGRSPECTKIYIAVFLTYHSLSDCFNLIRYNHDSKQSRLHKHTNTHICVCIAYVYLYVYKCMCNIY